MEKLSASQQEKVKKMNTDRLREKLIESGQDEDSVKAMDRPALMQAYAELITVQPVVKPVVSATAYDVDLERERLQFER